MSTPDPEQYSDHRHHGTVRGLVGPIVVGTILNVWLFGVMLVQIQTYVRNPSRDPRWIKMIVAFLFLCSTVSTVFDCVATYTYSVEKFGHWREIQTATWVLNADPTMTVLITSTVQGFFAWRIRRLTGKIWLGILIGAGAFAQFLCGLGTSIGYGMVQQIVDFQRVKAIIITWLVLAPVTDTMISVALVWYLKRQRTGFAFTDDIVSKITRLTIQTGAITALWSALDLAIFLAYPNNLYLILNMPLSPLYVNCFMSSLNARHEWNERPDTQNGKGDLRGITVTRTVGVHR
ncbi:hypothetical protein BS47DRAFT_1487959 [Hydnum rufescens UP504]|uniref:DUF6534 domain-containing protein n=1 Tax=Hydnum rufescens UP504 TaxID=1448309 RepID=A0A9P6DSD5_9AGAM|nr:hypothetical protein BS47DRAFT_1487959 [Hydnum rufescens UP504]